jgi:TetR/AcrR family transcriptional repressor of nem operon
MAGKPLTRRRSPHRGAGPIAAPRAAPGAPARAILNVAERLLQTRGYNGFSYADVAVQLGVTKASLHYHFPTKAELGRALIDRYGAAFAAALKAIDRDGSGAANKLRRYAALYEAVLTDERMCLCGMLAAEYSTLPAAMQKGLASFFDANERWLASVLAEGRGTGALKFRDSANERARVLLGALEGAMLVARSYQDPQRFHAAAGHLLADIGG